MKKRNRSKVDFVYWYLLFYIFWGFIFTRTVFENTLLVYFSFIFLLGAFATKLFSKASNIGGVILCCIPYLLYTSLGYLVQADFQRMSYWLVALFVIMVAQKDNISVKLNYRELYVFGLIAFAGIMFQLFFTSLYNSAIAPLFLNDNSERWVESNYGYNGFTYQLAATAEILIIAEMVVLFLWDRAGFSSKQWVKYAIAIALAVGVFLTGKRTNSAMAILVPVLVFFIGNRATIKKRGYGFLIIIALVVGVYLFRENLSSLTESVIFRRTANSMVGYETGDDFSGGREFMWLRAISLYHEHPLFGIGLGNFTRVGGFDTDVHNMYLQCLCEQGIVGFILFLIMIVTCLIVTIRSVRKALDSQNKALLMFSLACQLSYMLEGITENMNVNLDGYMVYAIAVGIMVHCKSKEQLYINRSDK